MNHKPNIYMDFNSTTPVDERVIDVMIPLLKEDFANSNSNHNFGRLVNQKVKIARQKVADLICASDSEIIFTSGATESINLVIKGVSESFSLNGKHIITVQTEHKAVLDTCFELENKGFEITYLSVDKFGKIDLNELKLAIRKDTILISIMIVNNETGVIQPIKEISKLAKQYGILFMTDATQAAGKILLDVEDLDVDFMCFSAHKMYGPKGIGALYISQKNQKIKLNPLIHGGGQERGIRSGTLNTPGIVAFGKACELASEELAQNQNKISFLRDYLEKELLKLPFASINGDIENRIFNTTNICFKGFDANILIGRMQTVSVSNGSACTSSIIEPSHVLIAMGLNNDDAFSSIRFSLGKNNSIGEIETVISLINNLTQMS